MARSKLQTNKKGAAGVAAASARATVFEKNNGGVAGKAPAKAPREIKPAGKAPAQAAGKSPASMQQPAAAPKKKPHRFRPGTQALREIRRLQKSDKLVVPKRPFVRLVREVSQEYSSLLHVNPKDGEAGVRWRIEALEAMQEAAEAFLVQAFERTQDAAIHAGRITVMGKDMQHAVNMGANWGVTVLQDMRTGAKKGGDDNNDGGAGQQAAKKAPVRRTGVAQKAAAMAAEAAAEAEPAGGDDDDLALGV